MARKPAAYEDMFNSIKGDQKEESNTSSQQSISIDKDAKKNSLKDLLREDKKSFEEMYKRKTFPIEVELYKRLEKHFKGKGRGYQTKFANLALSKALDELEG